MKTVARLPALLLSGFLAALPAAAQPRTPQPRLTCDEAIAVVQREGTVTLDLGDRRPQRFVRDRGFCEITEIAELRFVPTRDNPECPVGYRCREPDYDDWNWDKN